MIFKQKVLKEEKIKFGMGLACVAIPYVIMALIDIIRDNEVEDLLLFYLIFVVPIFLLLVLMGLSNLERYYIYDDHIEVRNIYGKKNSVFFKNVSFVEEVKINLMTNGMPKTFYIFNDGRKNNENKFDINSCYNRKKINLRIYKTEELENYVTNILKLNINA